jgi:hypothetical protein
MIKGQPYNLKGKLKLRRKPSKQSIFYNFRAPGGYNGENKDILLLVQAPFSSNKKVLFSYRIG